MAQKKDILLAAVILWSLFLVLLSLKKIYLKPHLQARDSLGDEEQDFLTRMTKDAVCKSKKGSDYFFLGNEEGCVGCQKYCSTSSIITENAKVCNTQCKEFVLLKKVEKILQPKELTTLDTKNVPASAEIAKKIKELEEYSMKLKGLEEIKDKEMNDKIEVISKLVQTQKEWWQKETRSFRSDYGNSLEKLETSIERIERREKSYLITMIVLTSFSIAIAVAYLICITYCVRPEGKPKIV